MIFRTIKNKENPYSIIPNAIINNPNLSYKAKGILIYLISKPDGWEVKLEDIAKHSKDGLDAVRSGVNELVKAGYIIRRRIRNKDGKMAGWESLVYEETQINAIKSNINKTTNEGVSPTLENPRSVNPTLLITDKEINTNNTTCAEKKNKFSDEVHEVAEYYQKKLKEHFPSFTAITKSWFIRQLQTANTLLRNKTKEEIFSLIDATFSDKYWGSKFTTLGVLESTQTILIKPTTAYSKEKEKSWVEKQLEMSYEELKEAGKL